jgi:hypothetical protein
LDKLRAYIETCHHNATVSTLDPVHH